MNAAQEKKYWWEWSRASLWYQAHKHTRPQAEAKRHELHVKALGRDKSMKDLTNAEFDKVLAAFRAVHDGGNLNAQLDADEQPEKRKRIMQARCHNLSREVWPCVTDPAPHLIQERKLKTMARNICKKSFEDCSDIELAKVVGALELQKRRNAEAPANAIAEAHETSERFDPQNPF